MSNAQVNSSPITGISQTVVTSLSLAPAASSRSMVSIGISIPGMESAMSSIDNIITSAVSSLTPTSIAQQSVVESTIVSTPSTFVPTSVAITSTVVDSSSILGTTTVNGTPTPLSTITQVVTQVRTFVPSSIRAPVTSVVLVTRTSQRPSSSKATSTRTSASSSSSSTIAAGLQANAANNGSGGLSTGGTVAVAVIVPIVVVALLVVAGIFLWRRRKRNKTAQEARRQEVEEYGYNPNDDPTLPAVIGAAASDSPEMSEEAGYRGWGNNTNGTMSARKPSTNLSSNGAGIGMAVSDNGGRGISPGSPDARSSDPLMDGADGNPFAGAAIGAGGAYAANRAISGKNNGGVNRGPSNASSTYSGAHIDDDADVIGGAQDLTYDSNYSQYTAYNPGANGHGGGAGDGQPIIKDVSARRNTKIENAVYPQPGNSGIAQNF